ncbi:penicillin-binding transpeptidase domain-containing protein [Clostridium thermarum]|uniref:penicillin-binding transpeptidase domain-containing protein n=1 Tax=Clostridium thermarum TaxID=1716543 RepID=UPI0013D0A908|nr:penicillin-binding transpeptidase domain-containing protein [Clostridium thermarum]
MFFQTIKLRAIKVTALMIAVLLLLTIRITYINLYQGQELSVMTDKQYVIEEPISNIKYTLLDSNGREMLTYIRKYYFVVDVNSYIRDNRETDLEKINTLLYTLRNYNKDYDLTELKYNMTSNKKYYEVDEETYYKLKDIKDVKGVYCFIKSEVDRSNAWLYQNIMTSPLDSNNNEKETDSIEGFIVEKIKDNKYPAVSFHRDVNGIIGEEKYIVPENNVNIKLTTDKEMEDKIKSLLYKEEWSSYNQIGVVIMESDTGKIKAMVQRDDWKPNINLCSATENGFEPGSIFKTIMEEIALEQNKNWLYKEIQCKEEEKNHGTVNMEEAYIQSCNTYFGNLGTKMGFKNIYTMARKQGLFSKVLNFSGNYEVTGDIVASDGLNLKKLFGEEYDEVKNVKFADSSESMLGIGQSMRISPLQALGMVNTVVNNGTYVRPYIIDSLVNNDGIELEKYTTIKNQVLKKTTAATVKKHMLEVVRNEKGTGKRAYVEGLETGGKTGTNTRLIEEEGTLKKYSDGWFAGFVKSKGKYYSIVVFVQDIDVETEGAGSTAAPIFKEVVEKVFR